MVLAIAALIFAVLAASLWIGHFAMFNLLPSLHVFQNHAPGQLGHDYPLGALRVAGFVTILVTFVTAGIMSLPDVTRSVWRKIALAMFAGMFMAMTASLIVEYTSAAADQPYSHASKPWPRFMRQDVLTPCLTRDSISLCSCALAYLERRITPSQFIADNANVKAYVERVARAAGAACAGR